MDFLGVRFAVRGGGKITPPRLKLCRTMLQTSNLIRCGYWVTVNENVSFTGYTSGLGLPNCSKLAIIPKNDNDFTNSNKAPSADFFDIVMFFF